MQRAAQGGVRRGDAPAIEERLARGLGWFSIGLGLAEVAAPGGLARLIGVGDDASTRNWLRGLGLREIGNGLGVLTQDRPAGWLWARVGGDAMDLAFLGAGLRSAQARPERIAMAAAAVAGVTALDVLCARWLGRGSAARKGPGRRAIEVTKTVTINRPPAEVYAFWRDVRNLPRFMSHLEDVQATSERRSRWRAKGPAGSTVEWEAEITEDRPNERIAWRSLEGAGVENSGSVRFARGPGGRGTVVEVELRYAPPGGRIGAAIAWGFGESPGQQIREDLRAFKQVMETGEIARSDASLARWAHAARPVAG